VYAILASIYKVLLIYCKRDINV